MVKLPSLLVTAYAICAAGISGVMGAKYSLSDNIVGDGFYSAFEWQAISDPTHGRVKYVDQSTSRSQNLTYASGSSFILRTDYKTYLGSGGAGRQSKSYSTHVAVFDVRHMPQGCGTWPAIWETAKGNWPYSGEVDIVEGVNDQAPNAATLPYWTWMHHALIANANGNGQLNCDAYANSNTGCGVSFNQGNSFGPSFNNNGGGWFAMERNNNFIKVWFWPRSSGSVPSDLRNGAQTVNTDSWGTPAAHFPNTQCNLADHFDAHNIIINLTLCGDWAGNVYGQSGCPSTCVDFVNNNPGSFKNAYFDFAAVRVYK
ncbi:endo-beta-glucanase [Coprinellus micaceus]|uniref:Endo-beta-glucanase n=1 Tax=Coprinellus micaceus TaxID=71717 RepID=A0A4Y7TBW1_COPMI|nr:endo-beta-glucanase [Coprinellus micaceus]